ncbi:hypothetical protein EDB86DRAFT_2954628 [Lactarius hatsudake]|nr:hypothetical protein EDB86DRAFT_2954628 [Lactarius hatsudake]
MKTPPIHGGALATQAPALPPSLGAPRRANCVPFHQPLHQRGGFPLIHDTLIFYLLRSACQQPFRWRQAESGPLLRKVARTYRLLASTPTPAHQSITDVPTFCRRSCHHPAVRPFPGPHRAQAHPLIGPRGLGGIDGPVRPIPFLLCARPQVRVTAAHRKLMRWPGGLRSRCLNGVLDGNLGIIKSMIAELPDETNVARGFSLLLMTRTAGYMTGPFIGGVLVSRPQDYWPDRFSLTLSGPKTHIFCRASWPWSLLMPSYHSS